MGIEKVSDRGKSIMQGTFKPKDFMRIDSSEKLVLNSRKAFGGNSPGAKPLSDEWVERHQEDSIERINKKITSYEKLMACYRSHPKEGNIEWYTGAVKKLRWFKSRKEELSGGAGAS